MKTVRRKVIGWMRGDRCGVANAAMQFEKMGAEWKRDKLQAAELQVLYLHRRPVFGNKQG